MYAVLEATEYGPFHFEDFLMAKKPTYEELELRVKELENGVFDPKRSEEALQQSTERFRRLFEQASDAFFIHDFNNGKIVDANESAFKNLGYTRDELLELNVSDIEISQTPEAIVDICVRAEKGCSVTVEGVHRRKNGSTFPVEISLGMLQDEDPPLLLAIVRDTAERKQAEESLRESEKKARQYLDIAGFAFVALDNEGNITLINKRGLKILGYGVEELLGKNWFKTCLPERMTDDVLDVYHQLIRGDVEPVEYYENPVLTKDGEELIIAWHNSVLRNQDGEIVGILSSGEDITDQLLADEALRESEEKYRSMMEALIEPIYICSPDFRVEYMNPAMIRRTGRDATGEFCFEALHDLDEKCPWCMHHKAQQGEYLDFEIMSPKDNRTYYISQSPVVQGDGSVSKLTIFRDVTEMRETEAQLYRAQKMEAMGLLAGGVAHDLNNILSGIVSYPELLLMDLPEDSPLRKPIKTIQESGMRAADVVEDLLTIARGVATGKEALNLNTIVTEYLESPEYQKLDKTHSFVNFETELDSDLLEHERFPHPHQKNLDESAY